jgi:hypothetical protein
VLISRNPSRPISLASTPDVLDQTPDFLPEFNSIFDKKYETEREKWKWHEREIRMILEDCIRRAREAYSIRIYVDALDGCGNGAALTAG